MVTLTHRTLVAMIRIGNRKVSDLPATKDLNRFTTKLAFRDVSCRLGSLVIGGLNG